MGCAPAFHVRRHRAISSRSPSSGLPDSRPKVASPMQPLSLPRRSLNVSPAHDRIPSARCSARCAAQWRRRHWAITEPGRTEWEGPKGPIAGQQGGHRLREGSEQGQEVRRPEPMRFKSETYRRPDPRGKAAGGPLQLVPTGAPSLYRRRQSRPAEAAAGGAIRGTTPRQVPSPCPSGYVVPQMFAPQKSP